MRPRNLFKIPAALFFGLTSGVALPPAGAGEVQPSSPVYPAFRSDQAMQEEKLSELDLRDLDAGKTIVRSRPMPPGQKGTHFMAAATVRGSVEQIFAVVTDCKGQPAFVPHLVACANTYAKSASEPAIVNYEQTERLKFGIGFLSKTVDYTNDAFEIRPFVRGWKFKTGDLKASEGYFRILPYKQGRQILLFDTLLDPGSALPDWIMKILTQSDLPKTVEAYKRRAEKIAEEAD